MRFWRPGVASKVGASFKYAHVFLAKAGNVGLTWSVASTTKAPRCFTGMKVFVASTNCAPDCALTLDYFRQTPSLTGKHRARRCPDAC
jgi:hypothetical protein